MSIIRRGGCRTGVAAPFVSLKAIEQNLEQQASVSKTANQAISSLDELEKLAALRDKGIVTEDEFQAKKKAAFRNLRPCPLSHDLRSTSFGTNCGTQKWTPRSRYDSLSARRSQRYSRTTL